MNGRETALDGGNGGGNVDGNGKGDGARIPVRYALRPPPWRPRLHPGSSSIGLPDFFGPHPDQVENDMSEITNRNGISTKPVVGNESFSAHDMIYDRLRVNATSHQLGILFNEVISRRDQLIASRSSQIAEHHFRQPSRVTLNEVKLAQYIRELCDPDIPLRKLARSVPHGYRGERMLDMLWNGGNPGPSSGVASSSQPANRRSVDIHRAIWFIRVVGASEIASSKARQNTNANYTMEWTNVVTGWLKRQINDVTANLGMQSGGPSTPSAPSSPAANRILNGNSLLSGKSSREAVSILLDAEASQSWTSKWSYSLRLVRDLIAQRLVDRKAYVKWMIEYLRNTNVAQEPFIVALVEEHLEFVFSDVQLLHLLVDILCHKIWEAHRYPWSHLASEEFSLMLVRCFEIQPEVLVNPARWLRYSSTIERSILSSGSHGQGGRLRTLDIVKDRNETLFSAIFQGSGDEVSQGDDGLFILKGHDEICLLDDFKVSHNFDQLAQSILTAPFTSLNEKLEIIAFWGTTRRRLGHHRPLLAARLMQLVSEKSGALKESTGEGGLEKVDLDGFMFRWISDIDAAAHDLSEKGAKGYRHVGRLTKDYKVWSLVDTDLLVSLLAELIRRRCFSYHRYIQRLTARGLTASTSRAAAGPAAGLQESLHAKLLRSVPVEINVTSLENQRRTAIYGNRTKESYEEAMERRASRELLSTFPWLLLDSWSPHDVDDDGSLPMANEQLDGSVPHLHGASLYVKRKVIKKVIMAAIRRCGIESISSIRLIRLISLMSQMKDYVSLAEVLTSSLNAITAVEATHLSSSTISLIIEHSLLLASMDELKNNVRLVEKANSEGLLEGEAFLFSRRFSTTIGLHLHAHLGMIPASSPSSGEAMAHVRQQLDLLFRTDAGGSATREGAEQVGVSILHGRLSTTLVLQEARKRLKEAIDAESTNHYGSVRGEGSLGKWMGDVASLSMRPVLHTSESEPWEEAVSVVTETPLAVADARLVLQLVTHGMISPSYLLDQVILPTAARCGSVTTEDFVDRFFPSLEALLTLINSLFQPLRDVDINEAVNRLALRSLLVSTAYIESWSALLADLSSLCHSTLWPDEIKVRCGEACSTICHTENIAALLNSRPLHLMRSVRAAVTLKWSGGVKVDADKAVAFVMDLIMSNMDGEEANDNDVQGIVNRLDPWNLNKSVVKLALAVEGLEKAGGGLQAKAHSDLQALARSTFDILYRGSGLPLGLSLLGDQPSRVFASHILDEGLGRLQVHLTCSRADNKSTGLSPHLIQDTNSSLAVLLYLRRTSSELERQSLASAGPSNVSAVMRSIVEQFETVLEIRGDLDAHKLSVLLRIACFLLCLDNPWNQSNRVWGPKLFLLLLQIAVVADGEYREHGIATRFIDVATCLLAGAPGDVAQASVSAILNLAREDALFDEEAVSRALSRNLSDTLLSDDISSRLLDLLSSWQVRSTGEVQGSSVAAIFQKGHYAFTEDHPWEWHENVDSGEHLSKRNLTRTSSLAITSADDVTPVRNPDEIVKGLVGSESMPLNNAAPMSLLRFGAQKTRDRVPSVLTIRQQRRSPGLLETENDYGERYGGEPIYARDASRGFVQRRFEVNKGDDGKAEKLGEGSGDTDQGKDKAAAAQRPVASGQTSRSTRGDKTGPKRKREGSKGRGESGGKASKK